MSANTKQLNDCILEIVEKSNDLDWKKITKEFNEVVGFENTVNAVKKRYKRALSLVGLKKSRD